MVEYCDIWLNTDVMLEYYVVVVYVEVIDNALEDSHTMRDVVAGMNVEVTDNVSQNAHTIRDVVVVVNVDVIDKWIGGCS